MNAVVRSQIMAVEQVRAVFRMVTKAPVTEEQTLYQTAPGTSHMRFLAGHMALALDAITVPALGGAPGLPAKYAELFSFGLKPGPTGGYPAWSQLLQDVESTMDRLAAVLGQKTDAELDAPTPASSPLAKMVPRLVGLVPFACFHTSYHMGQMALLRRAQGLPSAVAR